jgi:hypothetical protein
MLGGSILFIRTLVLGPLRIQLDMVGDLGGIIEVNYGTRLWLALFFGSAVVSGAAQLATLAGNPLGMSGVVFAFFGFVCITSRNTNACSKSIILILGALFVCWGTFVVMPAIRGVEKITDTAHVAHLTGLLFGMMCAFGFVWNTPFSAMKAKVICSTVFGFSLIALFWAPWQKEWVLLKGKEAYRTPAAIRANRVLEFHKNLKILRRFDSVGASEIEQWERFVQIHQAAEIAYRTKNFDEAEKLLQQGLEVGKDPVWFWEKLACIYAMRDEQEKYQTALATLKSLDGKLSEEVERKVQAWRLEKKANTTR